MLQKTKSYLKTMLSVGKMFFCALILMGLSFSAWGAPVTLEYWHFYGAEVGREHENLVAEFNRLHPDIQVNVLYGGTAWTMRDRLFLALSGNQGPDVASIDQFWISQLADSGHAVPLDELIKSSPSMQHDDVFPLYWNTAVYEDQIWSMPFSMSNLVLYYNRGLLEELSLGEEDLPRTWDQLLEIGTAVAEREGGPKLAAILDLPLLAAKGNMYPWVAFLWQNGGELFSPGFDQVEFQSPAGVETMSFWKELQNKGLISAHTPEKAWESGKVLFQIASSARMLTNYRHLDFSFGIAPLPRKDFRVTGVGGSNLALFAKEEQKQAAAWTFIEWITSPETNLEWSLRTGYAPLRRSAYSSRAFQEAMDENPDLKAAFQEILYARCRPNIPSYGDISRELGYAIEEVMLLGAKPEEALKKAAVISNKILQGQ
ncbi:MAG: ABC transporter substrate-binding protein [Firmicutes bacterium]|nr:ABC transporter substrate-binding protein [Bacillota bacterium]